MPLSARHNDIASPGHFIPRWVYLVVSLPTKASREIDLRWLKEASGRPYLPPGSFIIPTGGLSAVQATGLSTQAGRFVNAVLHEDRPEFRGLSDGRIPIAPPAPHSVANAASSATAQALGYARLRGRWVSMI